MKSSRYGYILQAVYTANPQSSLLVLSDVTVRLLFIFLKEVFQEFNPLENNEIMLSEVYTAKKIGGNITGCAIKKVLQRF